MVELVLTIYQKTKIVLRGHIVIHNDNSKLIQMINSVMSPAQYTQEVAAEVALIKQIT